MEIVNIVLGIGEIILRSGGFFILLYVAAILFVELHPEID